MPSPPSNSSCAPILITSQICVFLFFIIFTHTHTGYKLLRKRKREYKLLRERVRERVEITQREGESRNYTFGC